MTDRLPKPCLSMLVLALLLSGCPKKKDPPAAPATQAPAKVPARKASPASQPAPKKRAIRVEGVGFKTPESVRYDRVRDVYLVANINGSPLDVDGNGFISKVAPDGKVVALKWIDGAKEGVTLNAPKGMALTKDSLWVADIDHVRKFDRETGAAKGAVAIPGATFVNDLVASADGTVYASDSGKNKAFKPSGTDAVWKITGGKAAVVLKDEALGHPNGLALVGDELVVVTMGTGELYRIAIKDGKKLPGKKAPKGSLDGIVGLADGSFLVSSWAGQVVYRVDAAGDRFEPLAEGLEAPADIGFDTKRKVILIPLFKANVLVLHPL